MGVEGQRDEGRWTREGGEILNIYQVTSIFNCGACVECGATRLWRQLSVEWRRLDVHRFKTRLVHIVSSKPVSTDQWDTVSNSKPAKTRTEYRKTNDKWVKEAYVQTGEPGRGPAVPLLSGEVWKRTACGNAVCDSCPASALLFWVSGMPHLLPRSLGVVSMAALCCWL